jgi:hypothetical protein
MVSFLSLHTDSVMHENAPSIAKFNTIKLSILGANSCMEGCDFVDGTATYG